MNDSFVLESNRRVREMRPFSRFWRKLCFISILLEIFRRLNAISIAFYTPNAMHDIFVLERNRRVREMRPFTRFWRKLCIISLLLEIFPRMNAISITFNSPNAMQTVFSVETRQTVRKMRPFTRYWIKLCGISLLLEIFRRLNAISIAFNTPNATHAVFSVETCLKVRKMRPFPRSWRELCVISLLLEIFRRLIAISVAFYTTELRT